MYIVETSNTSGTQVGPFAGAPYKMQLFPTNITLEVALEFRQFPAIF